MQISNFDVNSTTSYSHVKLFIYDLEESFSRFLLIHAATINLVWWIYLDAMYFFLWRDTRQILVSFFNPNHGLRAHHVWGEHVHKCGVSVQKYTDC